MCVIYIILNIYRMGLGKEVERAEIVEYFKSLKKRGQSK